MGFQMLCPLECGVMLESGSRDGILRVYDKHRVENHLASPAQWSGAYSKIEEGREAAKARSKKENWQSATPANRPV
jgi:hypothetical protein